MRGPVRVQTKGPERKLALALGKECVKKSVKIGKGTEENPKDTKGKG